MRGECSVFGVLPIKVRRPHISVNNRGAINLGHDLRISVLRQG